MSKGSTQRPTDKKQFDEQYDKIFGKKGKTNGNDSKQPQEPNRR